MARKKLRNQTRISDPDRRRASATRSVARSFRLWWLMITLIVIVAGVVIGKLAMKAGNDTRFKQTALKRDAPAALVEEASGDTAWDPSWPRLPGSGEPARPIEGVRAMYAYAARRGDVLQYMPCYCGCERQGHRSNHDCFVRGKTAAGVPQWDAMGFS